jgi:RHS repeat-associated protein
LSVQREIAAGGGRRVPGRHRRGGGARRGRRSERAARGRVERREAGRAAAAGVYDVRWDINADGAVTWADYSHYPDVSMGRGVLSHVGNRFGYAGYQHAPELAGAKWHLRHRMMDSILGRFMNRDPHPTPYVDGMNLYQYVRGMPLVGVDPMGLFAQPGPTTCLGAEQPSCTTFACNMLHPQIPPRCNLRYTVIEINCPIRMCALRKLQEGACYYFEAACASTTVGSTSPCPYPCKCTNPVYESQTCPIDQGEYVIPIIGCGSDCTVRISLSAGAPGEAGVVDIRIGRGQCELSSQTGLPSVPAASETVASRE